ncbi:chalcone isomerase family protein [Idiomarina sp. M1R2S28]|uniref:Chalcone isomerase family protein n=1 Tax=Idiomarina rhizosphaerae TaxID=2961572 RepID=A0A9X2G2P8_9GAMM|nr:chalcone isomerase family protein [Idiomarina rhizosphaerae]MCP1340131.1 chalcone isomerase family protein [Idiomarina rhizosphaerae]
MKFILCGIIALFSLNSYAAECTDSVPDDFSKVGQTRLSVYFWDVYDATLYSPTGKYKQDERQALLLEYLRDIKAEDLIETTEEEWQKLELNSDKHEQWLEKLNSIWPDIKEGDCLLLVEKEDGTAEFYQGDKLLGEIEDKDFTEQFLAIWLSENSRFESERNELIGEK